MINKDTNKVKVIISSLKLNKHLPRNGGVMKTLFNEFRSPSTTPSTTNNYNVRIS